jgi:5-methyltetrahydrofolate--homocysteine methyltransferase
LQEAGVTAKIMVGGAPVTQSFAEKIGAQGYAPDAASAVDTAKGLVA